MSDIEAGWQGGQAITPEDLSSVGQSIPCSELTLDPAVAKRLTAVTGIQFEPTDHSRKHLIELVITGQPKQLADDLQTLFGAMDSCSTKTATTTGTAKLTVKEFAIPSLGDQQAAYVMTDTADSAGAFYVRNAIVRFGSVAVALGLLEVVPTAQATPQISDATFVKILKTAADRLRT